MQKTARNMSKKAGILILLSLLLTGMFAGCKPAEGKPDASGSKSAKIHLIRREEGSGTHGAFIELFGIEEKTADGKKTDHTAETAETLQNTAAMLLSVAGDADAIGYISFGSLNASVKALAIDGVSPSIAAIRDGSYPVKRPFHVVTKAEVSPAARDFLNFIASADGQAVVETFGCVPLETPGPAYAKSDAKGLVKITGSSSVFPLMEKLQEAYAKVNRDVTVQVEFNDSSTGINNTLDGICDIGMSSRDLKDSETEKGISAAQIATDGLAVIVNPGNAVAGLTKDQVKAIYTGVITTWDAVQ